MVSTTIDLGSVKIGWRGDYNASTTYENNHAVHYNGASYICVAPIGSPVTGVTPDESNPNWDVMAGGIPQNTSIGDIIVSGPSGPQTVSPTTADQVLVSGGPGVIPRFDDAPYDRSKKVKTLPITRNTCHDSGNIIQMQDNSFLAWGANSNSSLGLGDTEERNIPCRIFIEKEDSVKKILTSYHSTFVLFDDGEVYSWGENNNGICGHGNTAVVPRPKKIAALNGKVIVDIQFWHNYSTPSHVLFLTDNGEVWACGYNGYGQLGIGSTTDSNVPVKCNIGSSINIVKISIIGGHTGSSYAISDDGKLYVWGYNGYGELGLGNTTNVNTPTHNAFSSVKVSKHVGVNCTLNASNYYSSSMVLLEDGSVYTCGYNGNSILGLGDTTNRTSFVHVSSMGTDNSDIFGNGGYYGGFYILKDDNNRIFAAGENSAGSLGVGDAVAKSVFTNAHNFSANGGIKKISFYGYYSSTAIAVLTNDGSVFGAGENESYLFPTASGTVDGDVLSFTKLLAPSNVVDICFVGTGDNNSGLALVDSKGDYYQSGYCSSTSQIPYQDSGNIASFMRIPF